MIYHVKECDELFSATDWDQYGVAIVNEHICRIKERDWPKTKQLTNDFK